MPAQQQIEYGVSGLYTNPNPELKPPPGALIRADEVILRRPGMVEPRPGFEQGPALGYGESLMDALHAMIPFDSDVLYVAQNGSDTTTLWSGVHVETDGGDELPWQRGAMRGKEARKNLYLTTTDGIRKLTAAAEPEAPLAGLPVPVIHVSASASPGVIAIDQYVAYRAIFRAKDANDLVVRGAPSGRLIYTAGGAASQSPTIVIAWSEHLPVLAGTVVELYRTKQKATENPPDELYLAGEVELSATDVSNHYVTLEDEREDDDLGQALYTNPSREGIERANVPPPSATDLELFQGSLFASGIKYAHAVQLRWDEAGSLGSATTGIGWRSKSNCQLTNASALITSMPDVDGLQVGMIVVTATVSDSWSGTGPVRIISIDSATQVTVSHTWTGASSGTVGISFVDSIQISDGVTTEYHPMHQASRLLMSLALDEGTGSFIFDTPGFSFDMRTLASDLVVAYSLGNSSEVTDDAATLGERRSIRLSRQMVSDGAFTLKATHGEAYTPELPLITDSTGLSSTQDDFPNGLTWSKNDQPEHFMLDRKFLVGSQRSPILRILRARETLWILKGKGDGLYGATGFGERTGWTVTQRDADTYLLHPDLALAYDDAVYAWTNKGLVRITDAGVQTLNSAIADLTTDLEQTLVHDAQEPEDMPCAFAVSNAEEVIFGLPFYTFDDSAQAVRDVFVYHVAGQRFSRWFAINAGEEDSYAHAGTFTCAAFDPATRLLMFGRNDDGTVQIERPVTDSFKNADEEFSVTVSSVDTSTRTVVVSAGSDWEPVVGDALRRSSAWAIVTEVVDTETVVVDSVSGFTAGSGTAYVAVDSRMHWLPKVGPGGSMAKRFSHNVTHWEEVFGVAQWSVLLENTTNTGAEVTQTYDRTRTRSANDHTRDDTRALFTREISLGAQLMQGLRVRQADSRWRVTGITTAFEVASTRPKR